MHDYRFAQMAYEAYRGHTGGLSLATGYAIPEWAELRSDIQEAWRVAAGAVVEAVQALVEGGE